MSTAPGGGRRRGALLALVVGGESRARAPLPTLRARARIERGKTVQSLVGGPVAKRMMGTRQIKELPLKTVVVCVRPKRFDEKNHESSDSQRLCKNKQIILRRSKEATSSWPFYYSNKKLRTGLPDGRRLPLHFHRCHDSNSATHRATVPLVRALSRPGAGVRPPEDLHRRHGAALRSSERLHRGTWTDRSPRGFAVT